MATDEILADAICRRLAERRSPKPLVVGLCGAQGSGKSTVSATLAARFERAATFSLDDLYLGRDARLDLARRIHPLFATRGVPGTHDPMLGVEVLSALKQGKSAALPRFDKAQDDRAPCDSWSIVEAGCELVIFNAIYAEVMGAVRPARTVVPVPELHYGYLVEVDAVAVRCSKVTQSSGQ